MSKRVLTKLVGSVNAFLFLALAVVSFVFALFAGAIFLGVTKVGIISLDFIMTNFKFYIDLLPLEPALAVTILFGVLFVLSCFYLRSSKRIIKISNREIVGVYKKRKSISMKIFFLWIISAVFFTGATIENMTFKVISIILGVWLIASTVLLIIDKRKVKKEYNALKTKLENVEKVSSLGQKADADVVTAVLEDESNDIGLSNDRGQLVINEIAKLDKLKQEGVISNVEYTRMREKTIKDYGKKKKV